MSTLHLPPDEFALLSKIVKALSPMTERDALKELVREVVREELAAVPAVELEWTQEQIEEFQRQMDRAMAMRKGPDGRLVQ